MTYEIGKSYVFFIPPGWLIGGTIDAMEAGALVLRDAAYLDGCASGHALLGDVALANSAKEMTDACTQAWPLPNGFQVREEAVLLASPCRRDLTPLSRGESAKALKGGR